MKRSLFSFLLTFSILGANLLAQPPQIAVNQIGYYPNAPKQAVVSNMPTATQFSIVSQAEETLYTGQLGAVRQSNNSSIQTCIADFSDFTQTGRFKIVAGGLQSHIFTISENVHYEPARAALKGFYYQRVSMPLEERFAGKWARLAGHPDDHVLLHPSAATERRPAGTVISSLGGWYDAGDYNKYIVNCGITMGTLLSAYEDFPEHFGKLYVNIPESGNGAPDLLNEILYNLRWMLTMQDPYDGGVYNKLTNANFDGIVMPGVTKEPRYVVQKGTAATLDFAATMAQAARLYKKYSNVFPGLADSCLSAAKKAWQWALLHPDMAYNQNEMNQRFEPPITTGGYGDRRFTDEWFWAAVELYATTFDNQYVEVIRRNFPEQYSIPTWNNMYMLGVYTLLRTGNDHLVPPSAKNRLLEMADAFVASINNNAFAVVMGFTPRDFVWGSNSQAANQGIFLIYAYKITQNSKYLNAALSNVNYLLGQNATGYCFLTGFGTKRVMHPHHRPSEADGITDPIPGLLAGGPNPGMQDGCQYEFTEPETAFVDHWCSYASNEITINWNAPAVYLFNAVEVLLNKK
jgi:endoglucanase